MSSINKVLPALLAILLLSAACNSKTAAPAVTTGPHKVVPEEVDTLSSMMSEPVMGPDGKLTAKVKGKLTAPYMLRYQLADSPYAEFPRSLHVDFYNDTLKTESQLDARYGKYLQNQDKVYLRDSVVVKNIAKGDTLRCKHLWWDQHTERFYTDDSVRIYTPDKILYGTGMEADQNFRWYTITKLTGTVLTAGSNLPSQ
ncbi:LPS export ABC transporter periplasmic protein LptC [Puia sp.]|uniref:LPS export ABC transporter periplasmic protein LptC n=1 Tax=Puia sp. TaxID=2045100 RepID=UPI002F40CD20